MNKFKKPYLVQRLEAPRGAGNPFSFGDGLVNGGLSDYEMKILQDIMSFDYMGSAEFEFRAIPKTFQSLAKTDNLVTGVFEGAKKPLFYLCGHDIKPDVREWLELAVNGQEGRMKEGLWLHDALIDDTYTYTVGWLELENPFMFFIDKTMFENICKLFGVSISAEVK